MLLLVTFAFSRFHSLKVGYKRVDGDLSFGHDAVGFHSLKVGYKQ